MPEIEVPVDTIVEPPTDDLAAPEVVDENPPLLAPEGQPEPQGAGVHPLAPGGRRFEQVYAASKQAQRDLVRERELRIAAEAKLEVLGTKPAPSNSDEVEYTWPQLEEFITQGRITRADANAHREQILTKKLTKQINRDLTHEHQTSNRVATLTASIDEYLKAVPAILTEGSDERERIDTEFNFLASVQGVDVTRLDDAQRKALQLTALRTIHGPIDSLVKRAPLKTETHQGLPGGQRPRQSGSANPDQALLDGLSKAQVIHYNKMMSAGRYPKGWKDVVDELKFVPPTRSGR